MNTTADEEKLRESIRKTELEERVKTLPNGVDTYIYKEFDPDGIELSGGAGQKLAIARAIYRSAPIVVFDEPTSALDPIAQTFIHQIHRSHRRVRRRHNRGIRHTRGAYEDRRRRVQGAI